MSTPDTHTPRGERPSGARDRVVADAVIRLIDQGIIKSGVGRNALPHLLSDISVSLKVPLGALREAWIRLDTYRATTYDPAGLEGDLIDLVALAGDEPLVGL